MMCILPPSTIPGLMTTRSSVPAITPAPSAPRMRGFGTDGSPLRIQTSRWFIDAARSSTSTSPVAGHRIVDVLVAEHLGPAVLVDADRFHAGRILACARRTFAGWVRSWVWTPSASPAPRRTRRPSGTSASAARAGSSPTCASRWRGPRSPAIRSRCCPVRAASSRQRSATGGRRRRSRRARAASPRYTWDDAYAELREKLDAIGRRLGGAYRVLVDANQHVDREAAARSGVGFYGKNTMLITRRHGSWVVLGTLVTERRARADAAARRRLRLVHALHRGVPDARARRAGHARRDALPLVLDAGARRDPGGLPRRARRAGLRLRHLPGRVPVEPRHREAPRRRAGRRRPRRPRRVARGGRPCARRFVRPPVRAAQRPALAAPQRGSRARERRGPPSTCLRSNASRRATTSWSPSTRAGRSSASLAARERAPPTEWWISARSPRRGTVRTAAV